MDKFKIVFHLNCLEQGGAERVVATLANRLIEEHNVLIATMWTAENEYTIDSRIKRISVGLNEKQEKGSRFNKIISRNLNLRKFLKKEKPNILISFAKKANYRALIAGLGLKIPIIVSVRTNPYLHYVGWSDKILIPLLYRKAAGNVFQTIGAKDFFSERIQKKSKIILNPINERFINVTSPLIRKKEVVQSGRIVDFKNQLMLVRAFVGVHEKHSDYVLKIYGADSQDGTWERLEEAIETFKAKDYIFLMGGSDKLEEDLLQAAVFAFSSDWEGLPNTLMEAMALGLPIVATDCPCGGPATLIKHEENGLLIPIKDEKAMEMGINRLIENPQLAEMMGKNAKKIIQIANTEMICKQWEDYIKEICGRQ